VELLSLLFILKRYLATTHSNLGLKFKTCLTVDFNSYIDHLVIHLDLELILKLKRPGPTFAENFYFPFSDHFDSLLDFTVKSNSVEYQTC